jgi:hypothetical protein
MSTHLSVLPPSPDGSLLRRKALLAVAAALAAVLALMVALPHLSAVFVHGPRIERLIVAIARDPELTRAVAAQNEALTHETQADIHAADAVWIAQKQAGGGPRIAAMLETPASRRLKALIAAGEGRLRGAILMDARGRNVAVTHATSDYWQGDEAKWRETFPRGAGALHASARERGHDGAGVVCWASRTVTDAAGRPIGAVSVEVDAALAAAGLCAG